jgi:hypothetical protein
MQFLPSKSVLLFAALPFVGLPVFAEESDKSMPQVTQSPGAVLQLDETVISGNQELPKVLYILPWREPQGLPDIEIQAEFTEAEVFRRLYPPAYRRELGYFDTLSGLKENPDQEK